MEIQSLSSLTQIRIVVVEPAGALNVGSIARVMKNMGLSELYLVNPQCNPLGEEAHLMAVHGGDLLTRAIIVADLSTALAGCKRAIATTGLQRSLPMPLESPREALPWLLEDDHPCALIFGREDHGLSNKELSMAQRLVGIPTGDAYMSLNLAQAVTVCAYELRSLSAHSSPSPTKGAMSASLADLKELEGYYQHLEQLLLKVGFLYPHTASARMETLRNLYHRAALSSREVSMLRGILRQVEWAIAHPQDLND